MGVLSALSDRAYRWLLGEERVRAAGEAQQAYDDAAARVGAIVRRPTLDELDAEMAATVADIRAHAQQIASMFPPQDLP